MKKKEKTKNRNVLKRAQKMILIFINIEIREDRETICSHFKDILTLMKLN